MADSDWHLVGDSDGESSARSVQAASSRPHSPPPSATAEVGQEDRLAPHPDRPATPESERLADTVLGEPVVDSSAGAAGTTAMHEGLAAGEEVGASASEVLRMHCLQGLSQEGSLEGFAAQHAQHTLATQTLAASQQAAGRAGSQAGATARATAAWLARAGEAGVDDVAEHLSDADGDEAASEAAAADGEAEDLEDTASLRGDGSWEGLDLAGLAGLMELLGVCRTRVMGALRAGLAEWATLRGQLAGRMGSLQSHMVGSATKLVSELRAQLLAAGSPGLLVSLGLTTLATLGLCLYLSTRCKHLHTELALQKRETARLVVRILNLQDALQQPRVPLLRQTSLQYSGLVTSSMM